MGSCVQTNTNKGSGKASMMPVFGRRAGSFSGGGGAAGPAHGLLSDAFDDEIGEKVGEALEEHWSENQAIEGLVDVSSSNLKDRENLDLD